MIHTNINHKFHGCFSWFQGCPDKYIHRIRNTNSLTLLEKSYTNSLYNLKIFFSVTITGFKEIFAVLSIAFILEVSALIEHNDSPLRLYESRWLDPWPDGPMDPGNWGCRLPAGKFYVKKRLTRRRIPGQTLRYQFIASSDNLGDGIQDPPALPGEPDHFASQHGWIFCALGEIMGLEMLLHARQCGIEVLLVSLCVIDRDVSQNFC